MSLPALVIILVFAIPILAILVGGYKEWLEFKAEHQELGTSTGEIEEHLETLRDEIDRLEERRDALEQRVQNLETIVTSEAWIAQHDDEAASLDSEAAGPLELPPEDDQTDAEHTADIARRLRNQ